MNEEYSWYQLDTEKLLKDFHTADFIKGLAVLLSQWSDSYHYKVSVFDRLIFTFLSRDLEGEAMLCNPCKQEQVTERIKWLFKIAGEGKMNCPECFRFDLYCEDRIVMQYEYTLGALLFNLNSQQLKIVRDKFKNISYLIMDEQELYKAKATKRKQR